jgi:hypothetical protein
MNRICNTVFKNVCFNTTQNKQRHVKTKIIVLECDAL